MQGSAPSYTPSFLESQIKLSELLGGEAAVGGREGPQDRTKLQSENDGLGQSGIYLFHVQSLGSPCLSNTLDKNPCILGQQRIPRPFPDFLGDCRK